MALLSTIGSSHRMRALLVVAICVLNLQSSLGFRFWPQQELLVLGDSLSDNGNLFALTNGTRPNATQGYFEGRFSNGPVWNEYLAESAWLDLINRAIGGAEACNATFVPSILDQVAMLPGKVEARGDTVVSISIGGNDYLNSVRLLNQSVPLPAPEKVVGCIVEAVKMLLDQGFKHILVWNLPTGGASNAPAAQGLAALGPVFSRHNQVLADELVRVQYKTPSARILVFDFRQSFADLFATGTSLFTKPGEPCLVFAADSRTLLSTCENPDQHIFWDEIHPTTRAHSILAEDIERLLYNQYWL